ncbi:MAG: RND transporter [Pirellulaceae bacterium]
MKMNWILATRAFTLTVLVGALALVGCSRSETASEGTGESVAATDVDNSHGGWWCVEHGVPEEECALCDKSLVAKFKEDGDWCNEHDRPESQCFICGPKRFDKFAAVYEAKTGRKPPQPEE